MCSFDNRSIHVAMAALLAVCAGCRRAPRTNAAPGAPGAASVTPVYAPAVVREGNALARSAEGDTLYVADEDHGVVRTIALPFDEHSARGEVAMPGPPAQVLVTKGRLLVTLRGTGDPPGLRGPGLLIALERRGADRALNEVARVELPADAWGLAVNPAETLALVTSAWTHRVSAVDLASFKVLWSADVPREPRAVVVSGDGRRAYVTHLVRSTLTRIDDLAGPPRLRDVPFPAAPLRTPPGPGRAEAATLGWSAALSPDGARLFVPRQALGATGKRAWNGQPTVDVLVTADESELAVGPARSFLMLSPDFERSFDATISPRDRTLTGPGEAQDEPPFLQPRSVVYRKRTRTLLVASEGTDALVELDALSVDPSARALRTYPVGGTPKLEFHDGMVTIFPRGAVADAWAKLPPGQTRCGAPSGVVLTADEETAFVFCKSTYDVAAVRLDDYDASRPFEEPTMVTVRIATDRLSAEAALGRRLFFDARDPTLSGHAACASCHPEGRDDGHVWHEDIVDDMLIDEHGVPQATGKLTGDSLHAFALTMLEDDPKHPTLQKGAPRQTPMLAGRVRARGPYGWKAQSADLRHRVITGFKLHRWGPDGFAAWGKPAIDRAEPLVAFLRDGLIPPPASDRALTPEEERGRAVFQDPNVGCASCHVPNDGEYTHRSAVGLGAWPVAAVEFEPEKDNDLFKTPSLRFVGGTAPYFHDGSAASLEELIERNGRRMGATDWLSKEDRAALIAFLRTL